MKPADSTNEEKRLEAFYDLNILHLSGSHKLEKISLLASKIFAVPVAGIALVDSTTVNYKGLVGLDLAESPREGSPSNLILESKQSTVFSDLTTNHDLSNGDLAKRKVRFYAGVPLTTSDGFVVGDFFIASKEPLDFKDEEHEELKGLAAWVWDELEKGKMIASEQKMRNILISQNRELAGEKARSEAMLADIGDGVIGINDKGEIIFVNAQIESMLGYTRADLLKKHLIQAIRIVNAEGKDISASDQPMRQALFYKKKVISRSLSFYRKDGKKFPVAITATPVVVLNQVMGGVLICRDITKEMEVDRMKTEFISLASHQLRTPLSAMKWFCEILLEGDAGKLSEEQQEMIQNLYKSNERMIDLVNTLLNISRIESGRIMIDPRPTDLKKLIEEVILEVTPRLKQKKHKLALSIHGQLPTVLVDPKLVRHVYMNLITNAIKYTKEEGEIIIIASKSGEEIISQISDNGLGIPVAQQDKLFSKFFRAENIVKYETEGTGLGLYLVKAIIESSGGKIWFKSEENKGTTFWFSIPLKGVKKEGVVTIDS